MKTVRDDSFPHPDMALNANTYPKGAWVLHMLRKEIGDQAFFRAIRTYYERFRNTSVVTDDFVSVVEEISKQELSWFFEQWLNRKGCPELRVGVFTAPGGESGVRVEQLQAGEPYRFWLRLKVTLPQGQDFPFALRVDRRRQEILLPKGSQDLVVDPDVETLFRLRD